MQLDRQPCAQSVASTQSLDRHPAIRFPSNSWRTCANTGLAKLTSCDLAPLEQTCAGKPTHGSPPPWHLPPLPGTRIRTPHIGRPLPPPPRCIAQARSHSKQCKMQQHNSQGSSAMSGLSICTNCWGVLFSTPSPARPSLTVRSTRTPRQAMPSAFSWPAAVPSALRAPAPVN